MIQLISQKHDLIDEAARSPLAAWESFYVVVGSSGAALTGLQFVGIAIIAESKRGSTLREISAFGTPTIVHFCGVLLMSALVSAPWNQLSQLAFRAWRLWRCRRDLRIDNCEAGQTADRLSPSVRGLALACGASDLLLRRARHLSWIASGLSAANAFRHRRVALLLLFIGIHNAWDAVTYITLGPESQKPKRKNVRSLVFLNHK